MDKPFYGQIINQGRLSMNKNKLRIELEKRSNILLKVRSVFDAFAQQYKKKTKFSAYHDWPSISINFKVLHPTRKYYINKEICLMLKQWEEPIKYRLVIFVSRCYGIKELLLVMPGMKNIMKVEYPRIEKEIEEFSGGIDVARLKSSLEQAKTDIDESVL
jgi:hypothetical protein